MSKTTKVIAALGVVAGLGVAALPAFTYAAEVAGQVNVQAEVMPAIAMTIKGNVAGEATNPGVNSFVPAGTYMIGNYNTANGTLYVKDDPETTETDESTIMTSTSKTEILPNSIVEGAIGASANNFGSIITVYTNNANGYSLSVEDGDDNTSLVNGGAKIDALSASNTLQAGNSAWGYKVEGGSDWLAIPAKGSAAHVKENGAAVQAGETTNVLYAVSTSSTQATGIYSDTIVYTATTKNGS